MKSSLFPTLVVATAATFLIASQPARAGHVYGGIIDTNGTPGLQNGDALSFVNQTTGAAVTSLTLANSTLVTVLDNPQFGLYRSSGPTFTALASTGFAWEGSAYIPGNAFAARPGSFLEVRIAGVTGPTGATFAFWDQGAISPTSTYVVGQGLTLGTGRFDITSDGVSYADKSFFGDGVTPNPTTPNGRTPSNDPYGHIHGRSFTVDQVGVYTVSYVLSDVNGIQADSAPFTVTYTAVPEPGTVALLALVSVAAVVFLRRRSARVSS